MNMKQIYWLTWYKDQSTAPSITFYQPSFPGNETFILGPYVVEFPLPEEAKREYDARRSQGRSVEVDGTKGTTRKATSTEAA